jgi:NADH dehydrogenase/NADH:ubiquinone oxidoreductase subunit G
MTATITVDGRSLQAEENSVLLSTCLENGIYIPNLCHWKTYEHPPASCRLCFVEIEGLPGPVASCTVPVTDGMSVRTDTPRVRELQRTALRFLLSVHDVDCKNCHANRHCELQRLAAFLKTGLKVRGLQRRLKETDPDDGHSCLLHYPNRCVLCGRCIAVCRQRNGDSALALAGRGFDTVIRFFDPKGAAGQGCASCTACVEICPVGALALWTNP